MPQYEYAHNEPAGCDDFTTFQHMDDARLEVCPDCGKPVYRKISTVRFAMKQAPFNEGQAFQQAYTHKLGRKVEKGEQFYEVPRQPGGGGGEVVSLTGMTPRQKEQAITEAHIRAGDELVASGESKVELVE